MSNDIKLNVKEKLSISKIFSLQLDESCDISGHAQLIAHIRYCDVLPSKASVICGFWILYLDLWDKSSGGIAINYYTLNLTVITLR
jgi:hypothetical protein